MIYLRSALYALAQVLITPLYSLVALATFPLSPLGRYRVIVHYARLMIFLARVLCGIRYRVLGRENIPDHPGIVLSKHQSAWETMAFQEIFPPQVYLLKRELLRIPFFGWGLAMTSPIAIDRSAGMEALKQTLAQGKERLARGFWIVIFPEGTRTPPGKKGKYQVGGAWLAIHTGAPVVPVAHNAGELWSRHAFLKRPGTVTVSIGQAIDPTGLKASELNARIEAWIESEMQRLNGTAQA
ncbi:MAG: 1-acyl-sn-glycerol-3-phosphate acyltransferase [Betaproteobacteria bacterium]|nr:1-acyl-sn-glycerol-3-phosphate acyltransferase [Betaproteobacteria bacterium]